MKLPKIDLKDLGGVAMGLVIAIGAFANSISDKKKTEKMEELVDKVEALTNQNK